MTGNLGSSLRGPPQVTQTKRTKASRWRAGNRRWSEAIRVESEDTTRRGTLGHCNADARGAHKRWKDVGGDCHSVVGKHLDIHPIHVSAVCNKRGPRVTETFISSWQIRLDNDATDESCQKVTVSELICLCVDKMKDERFNTTVDEMQCRTLFSAVNVNEQAMEWKTFPWNRPTTTQT